MRLLSILILVLFNLSPASSQQLNYRELFGDDWKKAEEYVNENKIWMEPLLKKNNISYPIAIAVIFPELVRYSALRDKMEITLLKTLYINLGEDYANFSIGQFQMKPSFAEKIRNYSPYFMSKRSGIIFRTQNEFDNISEYRKSIVSDLEDPRVELNYLISFFKICEKNFRTNRKDNTARVRFLATAYNFGFDKYSSEIESMIDKKFFNTSLFKTTNYSYADVSLFWYNQFASEK